MDAIAPRRGRNAALTRQAILASARVAFTRAGYDGVGVREIANGAGVTAMLVNRYFGSKEQLFAEVVEDSVTTPSVLTDKVINSQTLARDLTAALIGRTSPGAAPLDGFLIMLRSASNPRAAAIWRQQIEKHHHRALTAALAGEAPAQRAAVILSLVAGFQVMRQMIGLSALGDAQAEGLSQTLAGLFQQLVNPDP